MRILWFINVPAGPEEFLGVKNVSGFWLKSLNEAIKNKIDLHIAFYYSKNPEKFQYNGVSYYPMRYKNWKKLVIKNKLNIGIIDDHDAENYLEIIQIVNPDIIHIHGTENPFVCLVDKVKIPVIVSLQGIMTVISHKYYCGIEEKYLPKNQGLIFKIIDLLTFKKLLVSSPMHKKMHYREIKNLAKCKFIIGRTDWDRRVASVIAPEAKYFHNDELMRPEFSLNVWKPKNGGHFFIHTTGAASNYKGLEVICRALFELNKLNIPVTWQVAGISEKDNAVKVVKKMLGGHFPNKGLVFLGYLQVNDLIYQMLQADIFVMASHIENGCNALSEAMLLGMPCISTLAGGTGTTLKDGKEGILVQSGDPWAVAGAVLELINNPEKAIRFGANARKKALIRHKEETIVNDLLRIYREVV